MLVAAGDPIFDPESAYYLPVRLTQDDDHVEMQLPIKQVGLAQLCMQAASSTEDSAITIATCNGNPGQIWNYGKDGTIKASGKCLDVVQGVGPAVQLHHCNGTAAQVWHNTTNASSTQNPIYNAQTNECLDDPKQSQVVGTRLQVHSCNGTIAQYWNLPNQG
jgi:hypothetical protein